MPGGYEGARRVLVLGATDAGSLESAIAAVADADVDHLVGIATSIPGDAWSDAVANHSETLRSAVVLDTTADATERTASHGGSEIEIRDLSGASLGDLGSAAVDAISAGGGSRPAVVIDSVTALTEDPGTRFKFLDLLGRRVGVDDGHLRALEGRPPLEDHERQTLTEVFEAVEEVQESA